MLFVSTQCSTTEKYFKYSHNPVENLFVDIVENQTEIKNQSTEYYYKYI